MHAAWPPAPSYILRPPACPPGPAAEYGLYGAFVPCIAYALLGSSRQLAVGPVAVTSIMLANGLATVFSGQEDQVGWGVGLLGGVGGWQGGWESRGLMGRVERQQGGSWSRGSCNLRMAARRSFNTLTLASPSRVIPLRLQLSANAENPNAPAYPELQMQYNHAAVQVAFVAGCFYTGVGLLRMGAGRGVGRVGGGAARCLLEGCQPAGGQLAEGGHEAPGGGGLLASGPTAAAAANRQPIARPIAPARCPQAGSPTSCRTPRSAGS